MSTQFNKSILLNTDSYKIGMWKQYPPGTEYVYSYIEARGGKYAEVEFLGIQAFVQSLAIPITQADIDLAELIWTAHGETFNRTGWQYILDEHGGRLPLKIRAAREGLVIPTKNVLCTIVNTDPKCFWLTTWVETAALRAIWYPSSVGTVAKRIKQLINGYLDKSGSPAGIDYALHCFGSRGTSSQESAAVGGMAHLVNFKGTDTIEAVLYSEEVYGDVTTGGSISAAEHSTITSWGRANEIDSFRNMLKQFGRPGGLLAVVSDSWNIYTACEMWGELRQEIIDSGATVVIRPDSGDPLVVLPKMLHILEEKFGTVKNSKGYKVLNNVRVIWGDGINENSIASILRVVVDVCGYSADNINFGMGGALLSAPQRDDLGWAMKCSAIGIRVYDDKVSAHGEVMSIRHSWLEWRNVFKDPITDSGKTSKKGRVTLFESGGEYVTDIDEKLPKHWTDRGTDWKDCMETYFEDGVIGFTQTFDQVRANSNLV